MRLVVWLGERLIIDHEVGPETRRIALGRAPSNEIYLDNAALSREHAELERRRGIWTLSDLCSTNGVFLNGERVSSSTVANGDVITLGKFKVHVTLKDEVHESPEIKPTPPRIAGHLVVRIGMGPRHVVRLNRDSFHVGREPGMDLRLEGWRCPARLALIARGLEAYTLVNLAGRGVFHNARPLGLRTHLRDGDRLEFRELLATFRLGEPESTTP
jgi:hypothetical protein